MASECHGGNYILMLKHTIFSSSQVLLASQLASLPKGGWVMHSVPILQKNNYYCSSEQKLAHLNKGIQEYPAHRNTQRMTNIVLIFSRIYSSVATPTFWSFGETGSCAVQGNHSVCMYSISIMNAFHLGWNACVQLWQGFGGTPCIALLTLPSA